MTVDDPAARVRALIEREYGPLVATVVDAAETVASQWEHGAVTDRTAVVDPLERELDRRGVLDRLPEVLTDAVEAAGFELEAEPVAAPPYVVVTSEGPVLRATVPAGRLVVELRVFEVERDPVRYRRRHGGPAVPVDASLVT